MERLVPRLSRASWVTGRRPAARSARAAARPDRREAEFAALLAAGLGTVGAVAGPADPGAVRAGAGDRQAVPGAVGAPAPPGHGSSGTIRARRGRRASPGGAAGSGPVSSAVLRRVEV